MACRTLYKRAVLRDAPATERRDPSVYQHSSILKRPRRFHGGLASARPAARRLRGVRPGFHSSGVGERSCGEWRAQFLHASDCHASGERSAFPPRVRMRFATWLCAELGRVPGGSPAPILLRAAAAQAQRPR